MTTLENINTETFEPLFDIIESDTYRHVFITGKAGTGKSTFLTYLRQNTRKNMVVLAPTGVAALNVKGQTIHSFFKFKPKLMDLSDIKIRRNNKIYKKIDLLVIDEISMVRADIFDAIEYFLRLNGPYPGKPFGGIQICVIGDLYQLPPVVNYNEKEIFQQQYRSPFFFSAKAFNAKDKLFKIFELEEIFRQQNQKFVDILNLIRVGNINDNIIETLNNNIEKPLDDAITLTSTNAIADNINQKHLDKIKHSQICFEAEIEGKFGDKYPAPENLTLKLDCKVMFIRNDKKRRWVNGTIGTIVGIATDYIKVKVTKSDGTARTYSVEPELWENIAYEQDRETLEIKEKILGSFKQYPLIYAWAITIHKSQGKTLDKISIDLGNSGAFAPGQIYVALSRCPSLNNISLAKALKSSDIRCNQIVNVFVDYYLKNNKIELSKAKEEIYF